MAVQITIVGGGSTQWTPTLVEDFANTKSLESLRLVLHDIDAARLERTAVHAQHVASVADRRWEVEATTDQAAALHGADFVIVCISTGGFASMGMDVALSERYGVPMPVGDTVGPAGISRAWRNVPVLVGIARAMERLCPDAWLLNVTNPLTALTRAVLRETSIRAVGLCHEVTNSKFFLSQLLDCGFFDVDVEVTGVNHLPFITNVRVNGEERWAQLVDLANGRGDTDARLPALDQIFADPPLTTGVGGRPKTVAGGWTKQALIDHQAVNYEILRRFGALPGADGDHTAEFFPGFLRDRHQAEERWNIELVSVEERRAEEERYRQELERKIAAPDIAPFRSMEMVAPVIESLLTGDAGVLPLNIQNEGQCLDLPPDAVVESMCRVDGEGIHGRDRVTAPPVPGDWARRVAVSQELTVEAACAGDRGALLAALVTDPITSRLDYDAIVSLAGSVVEENRPWRPA